MHCVLFVRPLRLPYVPAAHGVVMDAPCSQYPPSSHTEHAVCDSWSWNVPATHAGHGNASRPATAENDPVAQGVAATEPSPHVVPAGHNLQSVAACKPDELLNVPFRHGVVSTAPCVQ